MALSCRMKTGPAVVAILTGHAVTQIAIGLVSDMDNGGVMHHAVARGHGYVPIILSSVPTVHVRFSTVHSPTVHFFFNFKFKK